MRIVTVLLAALLLGGCVASNLTELVEAMGHSDATVCITITTIYGTVRGYRSNAHNGVSATCSQDGLAVTGASGGTVSVPVVVGPMMLTPVPVQK